MEYLPTTFTIYFAIKSNQRKMNIPVPWPLWDWDDPPSSKPPGGVIHENLSIKIPQVQNPQNNSYRIYIGQVVATQIFFYFYPETWRNDPS